jgi:hypothetical protein
LRPEHKLDCDLIHSFWRRRRHAFLDCDRSNPSSCFTPITQFMRFHDNAQLLIAARSAIIGHCADAAYPRAEIEQSCQRLVTVLGIALFLAVPGCTHPRELNRVRVVGGCGY